MKAMARIFGILIALGGAAALYAEPLTLHTRKRAETEPKSGNWRREEKTIQWEPKKTALIICDMWDQHWCKGATERVAEMAPRMNELVKAARAKGVFIIHAPSDTMKFYEGTPQRKLAQAAPVATPNVPLQRWCKLDPDKEAPLPIDDSDGGCDDDPQCKNYTAWKHEISTLEIAEGDAITDSTEAYNLLQQRGIDNVIVLGVHANMCVLGRPFSIRQMVAQGKNVVVVRDMTDTMYNSRRRPYVNHFRGTDLIVEHIERYWCPSITSVDFLGGEPFRFSKDPENPKNKQAQNIYAKPSSTGNQEGPLSPADALSGFKVPDDLEIEQVLAEPIVRQPLQLSWDERGRLWVVQYIQYPAPAGLTLLSKDQFWRAVYDKVPPPPPHHFKGEDKITIHEDTDGDGKFDKHTTFLEGLSIVTAVTQGRGGAWVLNPPYLLFFPDKNHDDVVDGDPEVHLTGFGLEDTHSVANSLRWGPDGWLYGCHGSTVTANIIRPGLDEKPIARIMGQAIWRYHPETKRFEVFAEGGGNAFGLEMDDSARIFSGHNGGDTRGFHYVQGGYLQKGFEKHGPLSNPYAFGYFKQMPHNRVERFTHTFLLYGGGALPKQYNGTLFGAEPLQGRVLMSAIEPEGSSFKTHDIGYAITTSDKYFKPVEIKTGPDGNIYVADWYDRQVTHTHNYEGNIDKSNGRIYRLKKKSAAPLAPFNWSKASADELIALLNNSNRWTRQTALRLIADRHNKTLGSKAAQLCQSSTGQTALEALWASHLSGVLDDALASQLLEHSEPQVRLWIVRLMCDQNHVTQSISEKLKRMALREPNVEVRSQLASSAKRLPAAQALPLVRNLLTRTEDAGDVHLPLQLWWAVEAKAESDREAVLKLLEDPSFWNEKIVRTTILDRLMKRYAIAGTQPDLRSCARIFELAPSKADAKALLASFEDAYKGRSLGVLPPELQDAIAKAGTESLSFAVRRGKKESVAAGLSTLKDASTPRPQRLDLARVFGEVKYAESVPVLLDLARSEKDLTLRKEAISSLQLYDDPKIASELIALVGSLPAEPQLAAFNVLASRSAWATALLKAVAEARVPARIIPAEIADKMRSDEKLAARVDEVFGARPTLDKAAVDAAIAKFSSKIAAGNGSPFEGQKNFNLACGTCHTLFGEGGKIGPDLTSYKRDDLQSMLMNIVNPSGEIREGYENVVIDTADGRNLSGFLAERYDDALVLRGLDGGTTLVPKKQILTLRSAGRSLMPDGLLDGFDDQQIRDLFAYLRSTQPLVKQR